MRGLVQHTKSPVPSRRRRTSLPCKPRPRPFRLLVRLRLPLAPPPARLSRPSPSHDLAFPQCAPCTMSEHHHDALSAAPGHAAAASSTRASSSSATSQGLASTPGTRYQAMDASPGPPAGQSKFRASLGGPGVAPASSSGASASNNWRAVSPGRASTGAVGLGDRPHGLRPSSELLSVSHGAHHQPQQQQGGGGGDSASLPPALLLRWARLLASKPELLTSLLAIARAIHHCSRR